MKLIIDIPEKVVTAIQNGEDYRFDIHTAIAQGIPYEEKPQGEWIANPLGAYVCNKCSWVVGKFERNFCPNCGAKMKIGGAENG